VVIFDAIFLKHARLSSFVADLGVGLDPLVAKLIIFDTPWNGLVCCVFGIPGESSYSRPHRGGTLQSQYQGPQGSWQSRCLLCECKGKIHPIRELGPCPLYHGLE
jgi:hypothetical protein